jgi:hypothetical protein
LDPSYLPRIAAAFPGLAAIVAGHPRLTPAVASWLAGLGSPEANAALTTRGYQLTPPQPPQPDGGLANWAELEPPEASAVSDSPAPPPAAAPETEPAAESRPPVKATWQGTRCGQCEGPLRGSRVCLYCGRANYDVAGAEPRPDALRRIGSPWLTFLRVMNWIGFGVLLLVGLVQMITGMEMAEDPDLEDAIMREFFLWVLGAFIYLAISMVGINLARDVSAIRAKLYSQPTEQPETPAA